MGNILLMDGWDVCVVVIFLEYWMRFGIKNQANLFFLCLPFTIFVLQNGENILL